LLGGVNGSTADFDSAGSVSNTGRASLSRRLMGVGDRLQIMPMLLRADGNHTFIMPSEMRKYKITTIVTDLIYCLDEEAEHFNIISDREWLQERIEYYKLNPDTGLPKRKRRTQEEIHQSALEKRKKKDEVDSSKPSRRRSSVERVGKAEGPTKKASRRSKKVEAKGASKRRPSSRNKKST
jgi:hypothetical protein